jgi:hypothetical protein
MHSARKVKSLYNYLMARAAYEKVDWGLPMVFFSHGFDLGMRCYFGVLVDDDGTMLADYQQPSFFDSYTSTRVTDKQRSPRGKGTRARAPRRDKTDA